MADDGDQVPLPACLDAQHAEAALVVVEGHPLHQASEGFGGASVSGLGIGWRRHSITKSAQLGTEVLDTARSEWLRVVPLPPVTPQSSSTAATGEGEPPTPSPCQFYDWWRGLTRVRF